MRFIYFVCLILICCLFSCADKKVEKRNSESIKSLSTKLGVDHLNIWVKDPLEAKEKLIEVGFNAVPDSLSEVHVGQGTAGRYFNFLNSYLELIFVYDQNEFEANNLKNKELDFKHRVNFENNGAAPFSIALKLMDYQPENIPFKKYTYHQDWMPENSNIYVAKNSKINLNEPSIFVIYPEIEWQTIKSLSALESIPTEDDFWKEFLKHPNGAKMITNIKITSSGINLNTETVKAITEIKNLTIKDGSEHLMEIYFDENIQNKSFDLRPELPLKIYL